MAGNLGFTVLLVEGRGVSGQSAAELSRQRNVLGCANALSTRRGPLADYFFIKHHLSQESD